MVRPAPDKPGPQTQPFKCLSVKVQRKHLKDEQSNGERFSCPNCDETFRKKFQLRRHVKLNHGTKEWAPIVVLPETAEEPPTSVIQSDAIQEVLVRNQEGSLRDSASLGEVLNKEKPVVSKNIPHSQPIEERLIEVRN